MINKQYIEWLSDINFYHTANQLQRLILTERLITNSLVNALEEVNFSTYSEEKIQEVCQFYSGAMYFLLELYLEHYEGDLLSKIIAFNLKEKKSYTPLLKVLIKGILLPYIIFDREKLREEILNHLEKHRAKLLEVIEE